MKIEFAETDAEVERCFPVMAQLRPYLTLSDFVERVGRQAQQDGYRTAYLEADGAVKAVAGFRVMEMLARGRSLYLDDLVTDGDERSKGYGDSLFDWLVEHAKSLGCEQLHLDSGVQRFDAHRFYFRKRMKIDAYHFSVKLGR
ncbi:MAG: GNAT family N-acetyltransferase [Blastocatellia bacterium]|nr:GNAT family N-acetyltransferase [Blastocatellia bacterium]